MKTIRRLYFYLVAFISMEVVLWGLIGLARSLFSDSVGGGAYQLAQALALILVGAPVFGIHWWAAQRSTKKDAEEHASGVRAFFFYAVSLALLIPVTQNGMAVLNRLLLDAFDISVSRAVWGGNQSLVDNLIAAVMNAILASYFISVLRRDWTQVATKAALTLTRRFYRYVWVLYSLIMSIAGVQQILRYLLSRPTANPSDFVNTSWFVNGLALTIVGVPLWIWAWKTVQDALADKAERASLLRLGVLYVLSLSGVIFVLSVSGIVVNALLELILGEIGSFKELMREIGGPLSMGIPLGAVWAYYGHWLKRDLAAVPDAPRRAGMNRLYTYILAFIGLTATFSGTAMLLSFLIDFSLGESLWAGSMSSNLTTSLSTLIVGLPLWLLTWQQMQAEALATDEAGDHARRSIIRKIFLYVAIFAGVVGGMVAAVQLISLLLEALLDAPPRRFTNDLLDSLQMLILFGGLLAYHWKTLQKDGMQSSATLEEHHAAFKLLVLDEENGTLVQQLVPVLEASLPQLAYTVHSPEEPIPAEAVYNAILLPESLALEPTEMLGMWLRQFDGIKLIVPSESSDWVWMESISQTVQVLRQLAEGESIRTSKKSPSWIVAVYILAGMMSLQILFFLIMIAFEGF